jgi:hypothetical protein
VPRWRAAIAAVVAGLSLVAGVAGPAAAQPQRWIDLDQEVAMLDMRPIGLDRGLVCPGHEHIMSLSGSSTPGVSHATFWSWSDHFNPPVALAESKVQIVATDLRVYAQDSVFGTADPQYIELVPPIREQRPGPRQHIVECQYSEIGYADERFDEPWFMTGTVTVRFVGQIRSVSS